MKLDSILKPEEVIEIGNLKIYLKGVDFATEQYIESPKVRVIDNIEHAERIGAEIASRIIRNVVKKVEGVDLFVDGLKQEFEIEFDEYNQMTIESYTLFMRILNQCPEVLEAIHRFYSKSISLEGVEIRKK